MAQTESEKNNDYASICDVWKDNVHKVISKAVFQTPLYLQTYTQVHTEFLHGIDNMFSTCYLWQKQYFDRLGLDKQTINSYAKLQKYMTESVLKSMDAAAAAQRYQSDLVLGSLSSVNEYARQCMDMYSQAISMWNSGFASNFIEFAPVNKE